jgi:hypothetical protein
MNIEISRDVKANQIWQHYKGNECLITDIGYDANKSSPIDGPIVIYRSLYTCEDLGRQALWSRPLKEFLQKEKDGKI